jgi:cytochrome oxidase assembly protein ShyY1
MSVATRQRSPWGFGVFTLVMVAGFIGLGLWQLQRRVEKHALIAPPALAWSGLNSANDEFRRVSFTATYARLPDAMVYSAGSAVREDASTPGTWAFLPARLASGETIAIDAGFVENTMQDRGVEDRAVAKLVTGVPVTLTGYLRFPESAGVLTPAPDSGKRLWFARDHLAMAKMLGWGEIAPFYIDLETPVPSNGIPRPGPLQVHLKDDHLQYAITWFTLAFAVAIAFAVWWRKRPYA